MFFFVVSRIITFFAETIDIILFYYKETHFTLLQISPYVVADISYASKEIYFTRGKSYLPRGKSLSKQGVSDV